MKKIMFVLLAVVTFTFANAQEPVKGKGKGKGEHEKGEHGKENMGPASANYDPAKAATKQTDRLEKELSLTADQKTKVYNAALTKNTKVKQAWTTYPKGSAEPKKRHEEIKTARRGFATEMNNILTEEQKTKWKEIREKRKKEMKEKKEKGKDKVGKAKDKKEEAEDSLADENEDLDD